jgi:hypothetical protein
MDMETSGVKLEEKRNTKEKRETIVKEENNDVKASAALFISLGSKVKLTELPTVKDKQKLEPHQFPT